MYWWQESGVFFECKECGGCCGGAPGVVHTIREEREEIAAHLGIARAELEEKYMMHKYGALTFKEMENYDCVFLNRETKKCTIYPVRPLQCREFPFWRDLLKDKNMWDGYAALCPGMNSGKFYSPEDLAKILEQSEK